MKTSLVCRTGDPHGVLPETPPLRVPRRHYRPSRSTIFSAAYGAAPQPHNQPFSRSQLRRCPNTKCTRFRRPAAPLLSILLNHSPAASFPSSSQQLPLRFVRPHAHTRVHNRKHTLLTSFFFAPGQKKQFFRTCTGQLLNSTLRNCSGLVPPVVWWVGVPGGYFYWPPTPGAASGGGYSYWPPTLGTGSGGDFYWPRPSGLLAVEVFIGPNPRAGRGGDFYWPPELVVVDIYWPPTPRPRGWWRWRWLGWLAPSRVGPSAPVGTSRGP